MQFVFAGIVITLLVRELRDEFRSGGSLHLQLRAARARGGSRLVSEAEAAAVEREVADDEVIVVSPRGVEIPVGDLTGSQIIDFITEIETYGAAA